MNEIKRLYPNGIGDGSLILSPLDPLFAFLAMSDKNAANSQHADTQPIITEDIDYEIVEPSKLPPSNTTNDPG
jgi:hypothetical protein